MSAVALRPSTPEDVPAMLALVVACDETYRDWAPAGWEPPDPGSMRWVGQLEAPDRWTRVAVDGGSVVGLVSWGPARDDLEVVAGTAHVGALFVHPEQWRRGIGGRLLDAALGAMREHGYVCARLHTPAGAPAEAFYAARGWTRGDAVRWHTVVQLDSVEYTIAL